MVTPPGRDGERPARRVNSRRPATGAATELPVVVGAGAQRGDLGFEPGDPLDQRLLEVVDPADQGVDPDIVGRAGGATLASGSTLADRSTLEIGRAHV